MSTMVSILIAGGKKEKRKKLAIDKLLNWQISKLDTLIIKGENSIGIEQIRKLKRWALLKPFASKSKAAIINEAEKLTLEAQNSLLKILEEPPRHTLIVLTAAKESLLLPTIVSRCKVIRIKEEPEIKLDKPAIGNLLHLTCYLLHARGGERIKKVESLVKTREEAITFLDQFIFFLRKILLKKYQISQIETIASICDIPELKNLSGKWLAKILKEALKTKEMIKKNVNFRLALENFFLDLPFLKC